MKTNKEHIYDFIRLHTDVDSSGITTQTLAEALHLHRSNVSSILNDLVREGKIEKSAGRPVRYKFLYERNAAIQDCFTNMIGSDGSLQHAIKLAKAAIVYPEHSLSILLVGESGVGKSFMAMLIHRYAIESGVFEKNAPYVTLDCSEYQDNEAGLISLLLDINPDNVFNASKSGVLYIDNVHLLSISARSRIMQLTENAEFESEQHEKAPLLIVSCDRSNKSVYESFEKKIPIVIQLPSLAERSIQERLALIQAFFTLEAARAKRTLVINAELLRCLLLYHCTDYNILQLKIDIKRGCASAYMREHMNSSSQLHLYMSDFEPYVRKGFLHYWESREEIEELISDDYDYEFSESTMVMSEIDYEKLKLSNLYDEIDRRSNELSARGMTEQEVNSLLCIKFEANACKYWNTIAKRVINKEQLLKLVDEQIIKLVEDFLSYASVKTETTFPPSVFYGLCLHISEITKGKVSQQVLDNSQIAEIVERHRSEYILALELSGRIEEQYNISLPVDESALIAMILCTRNEPKTRTNKPVILFALHGAGVASSLVSSINSVAGNNNVYAFDISYTLESSETYTELRKYIERIDQGGGIIVFYDIEFLRQILDTIELETGAAIRAVAFPITLLGIEWSRRAILSPNVDELSSTVMQNLGMLRKHLPQVIITLCTTGIGCAEELKSYIEQHGDIGNKKVIALQMADRDRLKADITALQKKMTPYCIVGTQNPNLYGIPFIPISDVLGCDTKLLPEVLRFKNREKRRINTKQVFEYLDEQLEHTDTKKLRRMLPPIIEQFNISIRPMSLDTEIGLHMHIACAIERLCSGAATPRNLHCDDIISKYKIEYTELRSALKPLEKAFKIIFPDDELANILMILYKL